MLKPVAVGDLALDAAAQIAQLQLPTLDHHVTEFPCSSGHLVLITHVLDTAVPFVAAVSRGIDLAQVLAIPYSVVPERSIGCRSTPT